MTTDRTLLEALRARALDQLPEHAPSGQTWANIIDAIALAARPEPTSAGERCGAWDGCVLPLGHNRGNADIPENHRSPAYPPLPPAPTGTPR